MGWLKNVTPRYGLPGSFGTLAIILELFKGKLEEWVGESLSWIPWGGFAVVLGCIVLGQAWADVANPGSWLRSKWRHWRRCFDVEGYYYASDARNGRMYLQPTINLTFVRQIKDADLILKVYELGREAHHLFNHDLMRETNVKPDNQRKFILAVIPIEAEDNAYWGSPDHSTNYHLVDGGKYMAVLCLRSKKHYQEHKIYMEIAPRNGGNFGRLFAFDEQYALLDWLRKPTPIS